MYFINFRLYLTTVLLTLSCTCTCELFAQIDSIEVISHDTAQLGLESRILKIKKNTVFAELAGNGFVYSVNYDRIFNLTSSYKLAARMGVQVTNKFPLTYYRTFCVPVELSGLYNLYNHKHFIEVGVGLSYLNSHDYFVNHTEEIMLLALRLGYRYQKPAGGLFVKVGFVPLYDWLVSNPNPAVTHHTWFFSGGIAVGYTF